MLLIESRLRTMFAQQFVAIIRASTTERAVNAANALARAGFRMIEVTMTVPGALEAIKELSTKAAAETAVGAPADPLAGVMIGAGTVTSAADARQSILNGAQFVVSPICETDIIRPCREAGAVAIPAGLTPTEIVQAWRLGAHVIKVFPAGTVGGPTYIRALRNPLPDIPLWVSGMVMAAQAQEYLKAGAQLVGLTNELLPPELVEAGNWDAISSHAHGLLLKASGLTEI
jgi:2-dehydro-3-deoxyphosphogluconate aldolase / (4S)-4-hydroxy-2-oxoglutarate aldolase